MPLLLCKLPKFCVLTNVHPQAWTGVTAAAEFTIIIRRISIKPNAQGHPGPHSAGGCRRAAAYGRAGAMLISAGLSPVSATLGALGVVAPALVWFVQPLISARSHRRRGFESEDYFWSFGPDGCVRKARRSTTPTGVAAFQAAPLCGVMQLESCAIARAAWLPCSPPRFSFRPSVI